MPKKGNAPVPAFEVPLSTDDLAAIGRFLAIWNQIENTMEVCAALALGLSPTVLVKIMDSPNIRFRCEVFCSIIHEKVKNEEIRKRARKYSNKISSLSNFRNDVAHGRWAYSNHNKRAESFKALIPTSTLSINEITQKTDEICKISCAMADLSFQIVNAIKPGTLPEPSPWHGKF